MICVSEWGMVLECVTFSYQVMYWNSVVVVMVL